MGPYLAGDMSRDKNMFKEEHGGIYSEHQDGGQVDITDCHTVSPDSVVQQNNTFDLVVEISFENFSDTTQDVQFSILVNGKKIGEMSSGSIDPLVFVGGLPHPGVKTIQAEILNFSPPAQTDFIDGGANSVSIKIPESAGGHEIDCGGFSVETNNAVTTPGGGGGGGDTGDGDTDNGSSDDGDSSDTTFPNNAEEIIKFAEENPLTVGGAILAGTLAFGKLTESEDSAPLRQRVVTVPRPIRRNTGGNR